ncbi:MAG: type II toxin-antitoxin system HigB family toxin [Gallionella sp.]|nr:type II toxin-antitoxin system HigB family toxin [Gallionella sp.]
MKSSCWVSNNAQLQKQKNEWFSDENRRLTAQQAHPQSASALEQWFRLCKKAEWRNFAEVRALFPSTDKVGDVFVFDIRVAGSVLTFQHFLQ